jgi:hypothetical protein
MLELHSFLNERRINIRCDLTNRYGMNFLVPTHVLLKPNFKPRQGIIRAQLIFDFPCVTTSVETLCFNQTRLKQLNFRELLRQ